MREIFAIVSIPWVAKKVGYVECASLAGAAAMDSLLPVVVGATHERITIYSFVSGVILSIGRIVGETAALIYTAGSIPQIPSSIMGSGATLAVHMYNLSKEGLYTEQAYAVAVVLLLLVLLINWVSARIARQLTKGKENG